MPYTKKYIWLFSIRLKCCEFFVTHLYYVANSRKSITFYDAYFLVHSVSIASEIKMALHFVDYLIDGIFSNSLPAN